jgi:lipoprotein-anchoring transpeptidase ErfK/SrfK
VGSRHPLLATIVAVTFATTATTAAALPGLHQHARSIIGPTRVLSNERTLTRWAHPVARTAIRAQPRASARKVDTLHLLTEDGRAEVYLLLRSKRIGITVWVQIRIPGRPNGRIGWVPEDALGPAEPTDMALLISRARLRATLFRAGRAIWSAPVGIGKPGTPTPAGHFWIRELLRVPGRTFYGPYAFGTSAYSILTDWPGGGVVGIHGTTEPWLIPGSPSHGCVRMRNPDIVYLARHLPVGAPVRIT